MSILSSIFGRPESDSSPRVKAAILMNRFTDCAMVLVPSSVFDDDYKKTVMFSFIWGVCDGCAQMHGLGKDDADKLFAMFVEKGLRGCSKSESVDFVLSFENHLNQNRQRFEPYVDAGGKALFEWSTNSNSPVMLSKILTQLD